ncbi:nickel ABC transporter permease [Halalkalibacter okhensis]|uniref:Nickel import system permease protein NikB n=1 Tax=Halalkalibacter okhensis TaxID=333138 RepID=A0A0B0ICI8_9BACI|nr:nickel ABC transporter permease [Halalkalibacter okhensis]KHF38612.1 nickel transporter permease NikB [Halalkalibacter okhensis]
MLGFILKRLLSLIPILFGTSFITFLLIHLVPGDPAEAYLRLSQIPPTDEAIEYIRHELGLNQPLFVQYFTWLGNAFQFDFGTSFVSGDPVFEETIYYLLPTVQLTFVAFVATIIISVPVGVFSAVYKDGVFDQISRLFAYIGASMPSFWLGFLLIYFFSYKLGIFPTGSRGTLAHLVLPTVTLCFLYTFTFTRLLRSSMLEQMKQPFILYARSRGLKENIVIGKHVLKLAALPFITALGMSIGHMLAGTVIVESVFSWPGIGRYFVSAILNRDYPVIQFSVLLLTIIFVFVNLLVDIIYAYLDPRIRWKGDHAND